VEVAVRVESVGARDRSGSAPVVVVPGLAVGKVEWLVEVAGGHARVVCRGMWCSGLPSAVEDEIGRRSSGDVAAWIS